MPKIATLTLAVLIAGDALAEESARRAPAPSRERETTAVRTERVRPSRSARTRWSDMVRFDRMYPRRREPEREENEPLLPMDDLFVPDEVRERLQSQRAQAARNVVAPPPDGITPRAASPATTVSFQSFLDNNTSIPPDTHGAVGPGHVMSTVNPKVVIQTRAGGAVSSVSLDAFFNDVGGDNGGTFDPKLYYDRIGDRWIVVALDESQSSASSLLIGASTTSNPTGTWNLFTYDYDASNVDWGDYPSVGFNQNWVVVTLNSFANSNNAFHGHQVWAFGRANLEAGTPGAATKFNLAPGSGSVLVPAGGPSGTMYLVSAWSGGAAVDRLFTMTGTVGSESLSARDFIASGLGAWSSSGGELGPQMGAAEKIDLGDGRMLSAQYRATGTRVWLTHAVFLPSSSPSRGAVQWMEINVSDPDNVAVVQEGRINDGTGAVMYAYPSLAVNDSGDMLIGYSRFSATQFASANYAYRAAADTLGTLRDDTVLKAGEAKYFKTYSGTRNRWGDYSATVVDPDGVTLWTIQEYATTAGGGLDRYATWWGSIGGRTLSVSAPAPTAEGNAGTQNFTFTVTLTPAASDDVTVSYATSNGTATAGSDYTAKSGSLTFTSGQSSKNVDVVVQGDTMFEGNETFSLGLSNAVGAGIATASATATINNDDATPVLTISNPSTAEGDSGTHNLNFAVSSDRLSQTNITVQFATSNDTATEGSDYTETSGTATIFAGASEVEIPVSIIGDTTREPDEMLEMTLSNPTGADLSGSPIGTGTITNDDPLPVVTIGNGEVVEGNTGTRNLSLPLFLDRPSSVAVNVNFSTGDLTATSGSGDYAANPFGLAVIPALTTQWAVIVSVNGDVDPEFDETMKVTLTGATNGSLGATVVGTGTIRNDDALSISIADVAVTEGNAGTRVARFTVTLSRPAPTLMTVAWATSDSTARADAGDYVADLGYLSFNAGERTKTIDVTVNGDRRVEIDERFFVTLTSTTWGQFSRSRAIGIIRNDD